jgi:hypothetical protein
MRTAVSSRILHRSTGVSSLTVYRIDAAYRMPLLKPDEEIFLIARGVSVKGRVLFETSNRIFIRLPQDIPASPLRHEGLVNGEVRQGRYRGSFQSKIMYFDRDLHTGEHLLIIDYPGTFRRERTF